MTPAERAELEKLSWEWDEGNVFHAKCGDDLRRWLARHSEREAAESERPPAQRCDCNERGVTCVGPKWIPTGRYCGWEKNMPQRLG